MKKASDRIAELEAKTQGLEARLTILEQNERDRARYDLALPGHLESDSVQRQVAQIIDMLRTRSLIVIEARDQRHADLLGAYLLMCGVSDQVMVRVARDDGRRTG